ncbi:RNA modification enzyme, MiaB family domain-containing protein [Theileria equi strain WA]|uniref:Threonylcarbamoyladenosine tRNA methylthiotransferase n=1 Tax=Theileria equi strain WA TaxID=1537102 RepID=L0B0D4_THEEQ|nr:RNA modification enzyme, MiaB family domain-containing protein [Theileria equi strain WA]AFZ81317.1 RNA modification enzyme, MiaB family domain-containing protein [Theileria equi strain WA]|eukprot:XP_004830983.1 RNA modification enzyme, MiaB family domain-containing protein [Theileria equi strain WA]
MSFRLKTPIVGCTLAGIALVSYIAYKYYNKSKKRRLFKRLKLLYTDDHELYGKDDDFCSENEISDDYTYGQSSIIDEFIVIDNIGSYDRKGGKYEESNNGSELASLESGELIEDIGGSRTRKNYSMKSRSTQINKSFDPDISPRSSFRASRRKSTESSYAIPQEDTEGWLVIDGHGSVEEATTDYSHIDSSQPNGINNSSEKLVHEKETCNHTPLIPGSQTVYFRGFGCAHNSSDSEYMMGILSEYGYNITDDMSKAQVAVINSCTVKGPSQDAMATEIRKAKDLKIPIVVGGCVPQADKNLTPLKDPSVSLLGTSQIDRIVEVVEHALQGRKLVLLERKTLPSLELPKIRQNELIEIIPLSTGCLGSCTFCKTKQARGVLGSYTLESILDRVESAVSQKVSQIWLTSEDTGAYGIDIGIDIVVLLKSILPLLPPDVMLRLGMSNPPYIKRHIEEIAKILKHKNVFEFIHIPVQSGSDRVLDAMNREYHIDEFLFLVDKIRESVPDCSLATDIICGFPTETDEEHLETIQLLKDLKLPIVNISQFYPRPGTPAAKMKAHPNKVAKSRTREVTEVFLSYECNSHYLGKTLPVWFSQTDVKRNHTIGHTKNYIKVVVDKDDSLLGKRRDVLVQHATKWHLTGIVT